MNEHNAKLIFRHQEFREHGLGRHPKTINSALRHIGEFEAFLDGGALEKASKEKVAVFKRRLLERPSLTTGNLLSASTVVHTLGSLKAFYSWLKGQPGCRRLDRDLEVYFTPPRALVHQAQVPGEKFVPTSEDIRCVIASMPSKTFNQRRDRAVIALLFLTGVRDGAVIGVRLKHIDLDEKFLVQDPTEMETKNSKWNKTPWYPVGLDFETIVVEWVLELRRLGVSDDTPLFPNAIRRFGKNLAELAFESWKTAAPLRKILRKATKCAGVPYFKPHAIRTTLGNMMYEWPKTIEELLALSEGLGHANLRTTLQHYVVRDPQKRLVILNNIRERLAHPKDDIQSLYERAPPHFREVVKVILASAVKDSTV